MSKKIKVTFWNKHFEIHFLAIFTVILNSRILNRHTLFSAKLHISPSHYEYSQLNPVAYNNWFCRLLITKILEELVLSRRTVQGLNFQRLNFSFGLRIYVYTHFLFLFQTTYLTATVSHYFKTGFMLIRKKEKILTR